VLCLKEFVRIEHMNIAEIMHRLVNMMKLRHAFKNQRCFLIKILNDKILRRLEIQN